MRVAVAFPGCHRRGGVERVVFECVRHLAGRGHGVDVLATEWETVPDDAAVYHRVPARSGVLRPTSFFGAATRVLAGVRHDVLNTHGVVCPAGGVHWVQSLHAAWLDRSRQFRPALSMASVRQRLNPFHGQILRLERHHFGGRRYRRLIATTEQVRADLRTYYDVPADDVDIVPNGFSPTEFSPAARAADRAASRAELGIQPDEVALLFVGNELDRKGFDVLLRAVKILGRADVKVVAVGRPPVGRVVAAAAAAGVADQVIACGPTSRVARSHAAADVFVLPTQYEAFCLAILEALGSGLPVITTDVAGARDAVRPGVNGLLINNPRSAEALADAISQLADPGVRGRLSAAAAGTVQHHRWPAVLGRYEQVLSENAS